MTADEKRLHEMMADPGPAPTHDANGWPDEMVPGAPPSEMACPLDEVRITDPEVGMVYRVSCRHAEWDAFEPGRAGWRARGWHAAAPTRVAVQTAAGPAPSCASPSGTGGPAALTAAMDGIADELRRLEASTREFARLAQVTVEEIEWTDATWNPVTGCTKVSAGCDNCYAATLTSGRLKHLPEYQGLAVAGQFTGQVRVLPDRLDWPRRWRKPRRVFVASMSDLFHESVPDVFIAQVFAEMHGNPRHTFQVLTKRHARARAWLRRCAQWDGYITHNGNPPASYGGDGVIVGVPERWPLPNVWLGVSVENQRWADIRIPALLDTPAAVRWISAEPLLGPVDLRRWLLYSCPVCDRSAPWTDGRSRTGGDEVDEYWCQTCGAETPLAGCEQVGLNWVVAGGESGRAARPMGPGWARSLRDQCVATGVPYLFKQWGEWAPTGQVGIGNIDPHERLAGQPDGRGYREVIRRVGKKAAGRELDGRTWDEYPVARAILGAATQPDTGRPYYAELLRRVITTGRTGLTTVADADQARYNDVDRINRQKAEAAQARAEADLYRARADGATEAAETLRAWCNERTVPSRYRREGVELAAEHLEAAAKFRRMVATRHPAQPETAGPDGGTGTVTP